MEKLDVYTKEKPIAGKHLKSEFFNVLIKATMYRAY